MPISKRPVKTHIQTLHLGSMNFFERRKLLKSLEANVNAQLNGHPSPVLARQQKRARNNSSIIHQIAERVRAQPNASHIHSVKRKGP